VKKFLAICLVLVLVLAIALPTAVSASGITAGVNGDVPPVPVLSSISTATGTPQATGGSIVDISEILTGSSFDAAAVVTVTITGVGVTADVVSVDSPTQITATFHLAVGPTTLANVRNVNVHQSGQDSVDTVSFTVGGYIVVTAPSAVALGVMTAGGDTTGHSVTLGSVETNDASNNGISIADLKAHSSGYMNTLSTGLGTSLSNEFQISKDGTTYAGADSLAGISYSNVANTGTFPFFVKQHVAPGVTGDTAGSYQITITFTGSAN
jgi:hypothetical protein